MPGFKIELEINQAPGEILERIFKIENWQSFRGWGLIPGISHVTLIMPNESRLGAIFDVINTDGSQHRETVIEYEEGEKLVMRMDNFSSPLDKMASHFIERWEFVERLQKFYVIRCFELQPRNVLGRIVLIGVLLMLRRAVRDHTKELADSPAG